MPPAWELNPDDEVSRCIYSRRHFSSANHCPKPSAFDPWPHHELSVVHTTDLAPAGVWLLAAHVLGAQPRRDTIYARADARVLAFIQQKLRAFRDDNPFPRHTSVVGWPEVDDPVERKEWWKLICLELRQSPEITLVLPDAPITLNSPTAAM